MKIYFAHSSGFDFKNELYKPIKLSGLDKDYEMYFPMDGRDGWSASVELIKKYDLMIAEVSYPSTGTGAEIAFAKTLGVPVIALYLDISEPSMCIEKLAEKIYIYRSGEIVSAVKKAIHHAEKK